MLGTEGVRLPSPMDGKPGRLKLELVKSEADETLLLEEIIHPSLVPALPRGVEVIQGASGSITSLREPVRLWNVSIVLELMGRVVSTVLESTPHLHPADPVAGEGEWLCFRELQAYGDFAWWSGVDSWGQEGFLADMESGHFRVEVLELRPVPHRGLLLLLECLVLGDSTDMSGAAAMHGDCLAATSSLSCW